MQPATAELIIKRGLTDQDAIVYKAARKALRELANDQAVNGFLFNELDKSVRKSMAPQITCEYFRALVATENETHQAKLVKWLDDYLSSPKANWLVPMIVIDDFGLQGDLDAVQAVRLLAKAKAFGTHFGYRRCVVQAIIRIKKPEAIDYLIELLPSTEGLIQYDVVLYLTGLTKQKFRDNDSKWSVWWKDCRADFQFPDGEDPLLESSEEDDEQLKYYGIPICAKRVVFVLDTSLSMHGHPMEAAKIALLKAVESLPESVQFDIVLFDTHATTWRPRLSHATVEAKKEAGHLVIAREMGAGTASSDALLAAFKLDPEAIYFISDGKPTDFPPEQIITAVTLMNRIRRISIYSVGLVTGNRGGMELTNFMQPLAEQNWGSFRLVQ